MLKLCLALPIFYPTFAGGPLRFLRSQPGLRKRDVHARVLAGTARAKDDFHEEDSEDSDAWRNRSIGAMLPIAHLEGMPVHRVRLPEITGILRTSTYFRSLIALCEDPRTRPDVIQLHSFERLESLFWLWRLRRLEIPIVYAIQIARPVRHRSAILKRLKKAMLRAFYDRFDAVVTNSEPIHRGLCELGVRTPVAVIPNGVDLEQFRGIHDAGERRRARIALGINGPGPVVLSVGAICPRKGTDLLVEAWTQLLIQFPDAELLLVGPRHDRNNPNLGPYAGRLRALIAASPRPDQIHFSGVQNDMNAVYAAADIVVLASSREGMPNVVLEAMACERPLLLTRFAGQSDVIGRPGIEFRESERSASALAEALADMLNDPIACEEFIRRGRRWVTQHLDLELNLDRMADFYRAAANGFPAPSTQTDASAKAKLQ